MRKVIIVFLLITLGFISVRLVNKYSKKKSTADSSEVKGQASNRLVKKITTLVNKVGGRVDWSHKNDLIAFGKLGNDGYADIFTMNPDGSNQVCLTCSKTAVPQLSNDQPEWHPSGDYIVFESQDPNLKLPVAMKLLEKQLTQGGSGVNNNLWAVTKDGGQFYQLTYIKNTEASLHPHFSHDGKQLLWSARVLENGRNGHWVLKLADFIIGSQGPYLANEQTFEPFGTLKAFYESHGFSLDDSKIIFSASKSVPYDLDIYTYDLKTKQLANLTNSPGEWDEHSILSPSGKKLVWISSKGYQFAPTNQWQRTLKTDYWLMNIDGSGKEKLTHFNEPGFSEYTGERTIVADSAWNKDGDRIVATMAVGTKGSRIVLIELNQPQ